MTLSLRRPPFAITCAYVCLTVLSFLQTSAQAQDSTPPKAIVVLVGDTDQFNIGQNGFCGKRTDITPAAGARFKIPANQKTYFSVRSTFRTAQSESYCGGEYSFLPLPDLLYMIRYTGLGERCLLEVFQSTPGSAAAPASVPFDQEAPRSCLGK